MTEPIDRIEAALTRLGAEHEPPVGWQARVLAATAPRKRKPWWWFAVPVAALAVVAPIVVLSQPKHQNLQLAVTVEKPSAVARGASANVGDIVHAIATGGRHHRAVWVYRNEHLLVACPGAAQCRSSGEVTMVDVGLTVMGSYTIVALTSNSPVPPPTGAFDLDLANAQKAGAIVTSELLPVH